MSTLPACRRSDCAHEWRQRAALYRRALPACFAECAEGDAPAGRAGKDAGAHPRLARDLPRPHHPLDFHRRLSRRDRGGFRFLLDWLDEARLDRVGAFQYEPVKGAAANDLGLEPVPDEIKASRHKRFMARAQAISSKKLAAKVGKRLEAIVDEGGAREAKGRTKGDSPQIDGAVHIATRKPLRAGDIVTVKIDRSDAYDLWGTAA